MMLINANSKESTSFSYIKELAKDQIANLKTIGVLMAFGLNVMAGSGCSTMVVNADYDPSVNFTRFRTYSWVPAAEKKSSNPLEDDTLLMKQVQYAVNQTMAGKSFLLDTTGKADFMIAAHAGTKERVNVANYGYRYGSWRGYARNYNYYAPLDDGPRVETYRYTEGTLILDFIDAQSKELFWRGRATEVLYATMDSQKTISEAVVKILQQFPPRP